ncbi:hypothetical protein GCM10023235_15270 [Kitasatospora terrestris]|uniref:Uncharacterized protein n=1 Tax=Kitasatospora terrestris TaxID=258051 RepID=A0ABP9DCZ9_9ACTN
MKLTTDTTIRKTPAARVPWVGSTKDFGTGESAHDSEVVTERVTVCSGSPERAGVVTRTLSRPAW